jgi:hypothetical protein
MPKLSAASNSGAVGSRSRPGWSRARGRFPRATAAPTRCTACASAQNRRAPALDVPSAARSRRRAGAIGPSLFICRAAITRGARADGRISALFEARQRNRAARRSPQRTARPAQTDRLHRRQESPTKPRRRRAWQGRTLTAGQVSQAAKNGHSAWSGGNAPSQRAGCSRPCQPYRWRSHIRIGVRDLTPLPLRYFAAVPGP